MNTHFINELLFAAMLCGILFFAYFKKKGFDWYIESEECICILNLQRSPSGDSFYINLAIHVKELDPTTHPRYYQCGLNIRLNDIALNESRYQRCIDYFYSHGPEEISSALRIVRKYIELYAIPFLFQCTSIEGLKNAIFDYNLNIYLGLDIRNLLKIQIN